MLRVHMRPIVRVLAAGLAAAGIARTDGPGVNDLRDVKPVLARRTEAAPQREPAAVAETMGAKGIRVQKPGDRGGALEQAFAAQRPCVVDAATYINAIALWGYVGA